GEGGGPDGKIPPSWPGLAARRLRMGEASIAVSAERNDGCYRTTVEAPAGLRLTIGYTLPAGLEIEAVTLDGAPTAIVPAQPPWIAP
ncbi:MAG TPA: hypothetical protein VFU22_21330, partial [Roseiflexaceae bacterium]|nr:hypothetical protein [Roseiflexaceae bacterium]